jgi:hypothetical protein
MKQAFDEFLAAREALFRNPSDEGAHAWWTSEGYPPPIHPGVPLETLHKARLQWLDATDDMLAESGAFLFDRGYRTIPNIRAYASRTRDAARAETRRSAAQGPRRRRRIDGRSVIRLLRRLSPRPGRCCSSASLASAALGIGEQGWPNPAGRFHRSRC